MARSSPLPDWPLILLKRPLVPTASCCGPQPNPSWLPHLTTCIYLAHLGNYGTRSGREYQARASDFCGPPHPCHLSWSSLVLCHLQGHLQCLFPSSAPLAWPLLGRCIRLLQALDPAHQAGAHARPEISREVRPRGEGRAEPPGGQ